MFVTKDLNMHGVCGWLDPQMLDIWFVHAPMKNNAEDAMKASLFLLSIKVVLGQVKWFILQN